MILKRIGIAGLALATAVSLVFAQRIMNPQAETQAKERTRASLAAASKVVQKTPMRLRSKLSRGLAAKSAAISTKSHRSKNRHSLTSTDATESEKAIPYFVGIKVDSANFSILLEQAEDARKSIKAVAAVYAGSKMGDRLNELYEALGKAKPDYRDCSSKMIDIMISFSTAYVSKSAIEGYNYSLGLSIGGINFGLLQYSAELDKDAKTTITSEQAGLKKLLDKPADGVSDEVKAGIQKIIDASPDKAAEISSAVTNLNSIFAKKLG